MHSQVKTRFLLLSDTHSSLPMRAIAAAHSKKYAYSEPLPEADVAIHTGDLTNNGKKEEHEAAIRLLKSLTAPLKIVIPGNHDLTLDTKYYATHGHLWGPKPKYNDQDLEYIRDLYTNAEAKANGIHYMEEGTQTFHLQSGAILTVYASAYTPEFCQWAFAYPRSKDRYNAANAENMISSFTPRPAIPPSQTERPDNDDDNDVPGHEIQESPVKIPENRSRNIDVILTHGPPLTILDRTIIQESVGCNHLLTATTRARPLLHCFGHIHEGWGAIRKTWPSSSVSSKATTKPIDTDTDTDINTGSTQQDLWTLSDQGIKAIPDINTNMNTNWVTIDPEGYPNEEQEQTKQWKASPQSIVENHGCFIDATDLARGKETVFVNAAIMNLNYTPAQAPFVVDLMLDKY